MNKKEIKIGQVYIAKVSGELASVRITGELAPPRSGWIGINLATNRGVHIKSAARLRYPDNARDYGEFRNRHQETDDSTLRDDEREDFWLLDQI